MASLTSRLSSVLLDGQPFPIEGVVHGSYKLGRLCTCETLVDGAAYDRRVYLSERALGHTRPENSEVHCV